MLQTNKETQAKVKRFFTNQTNAKLTSRYLVERSYLLSSTKKILHVNDTELQFYPMNQQLERTDTISYSEIQSIQINNRDEKEFTIITKSNAYHTFTCRERGRLLSEIYLYYIPYYQAIKDVESDQSAFLKFQEKVIHQMDIYHEEDTAKNATFSVYNSLIEITYKANQFGMDDKDNYFGGGQGVRASTETNFRMSFRDAVGGNSQLARMQTQRPDKQIPEENESNESTNTILLIEIEGIRTYETTMYIIKHNTEILKFIFGTVDKVNKAVQSILMSADAYINYQIIHHKEDDQLNITANTKKRDSLTMKLEQDQPPFNEMKFYEDFYTPEKLKDPIYKSEGLLYLDNNLPPLYVMFELNEEQFIVIEADNKKIRTVGYLREIKFIVVNEDQLNRQGELTLCFIKKNGFIQEIALKSQNIEELICALISLRQLLNSNTYSLQLQMHQPDLSQKIQGLIQDNDAEYESSIFRKLQLQQQLMKEYQQQDQEQFDNDKQVILLQKQMNELILNTNFTSMPRVSVQAVKQFADQIERDVKEYLDFEREQGVEEIFGELDSTDSSDEGQENSNNQTDESEEQYENQDYSDYSDEDNYGRRQRDQVNLIQNEKQKNQQLVQLTSQLSRLLIMLKLSLNSSQFFKELVEDHEFSIKKYQNLNEQRQETQNKRLLLRNSNLDILKKLKTRLHQQFKYFERQGTIRTLHLMSFTMILSSFLSNRKETTHPDEYRYLISEVYNEKEDYRILNIIERFTMTEHFWLTLSQTQTINDIFGFLQKNQAVQFYDIQAHFMVFTIQLLHQMYLHFTSPLEVQRSQSIKFLARFLHKNKDGIQVLLKIFKKRLFMQVETSQELLKNYAWDETQWSQFFTIILNGKLDRPEVQWNDNILIELVIILKKEVDSFIKAKRKHRQIIDQQLKDLSHPVHEYATDHSLVSRVKHLRWNYNELNINYSIDQNMFKVGKYYLSRLLIEDPEGSQQPYLDIKLNKNKMISFWYELQQRFMTTQEIQERDIILKVMILIYQRNYQVIKELRTMPYWIRLLESYEYKKSHILILQLILQALAIQDPIISQQNYEIFTESQGTETIVTCLFAAFNDLEHGEYNNQYQNQEDYGEHRIREFNADLDNNKFLQLQLHKIDSIKKICKIRNYTDCLIDDSFIFKNTKSICKTMFALKVIELLMQKRINQTIYPLPMIKQLLIQPQNANTLSQLLLLQNTEISNQILNLLNFHLNSQFCYKKFINTGIIEYLLLHLDSYELSNQAFELLQKLQEVVINYNEDLHLDRFFDANDIKIINSSQIEQSLFLRYMPLPLVIKACGVDSNEFIEIFKENSYENATLIWNSEMRDILKSTILQNSEQIIDQLILNSRNYNAMGDDYEPDHPTFTSPVDRVIQYQFIEEEVRCGQYYLRVWIMLNDKDQEAIPYAEENGFILDLKNIMQQAIQHIKETEDEEVLQILYSKLLIMLKANLKALRKFTNKNTFCLEEIKSICIHILNDQNFIYSPQIKRVLKISSQTLITAIDIDKKKQNLYQINSAQGIEIVYKIMKNILNQSQLQNEEDYIAQSVVNFDEKAINIVTEESDNSIDLPMNYEERINNIRQSQMQQSIMVNEVKLQSSVILFEPKKIQSLSIDKLDAKILQNCLQCMDKLLKMDIQSFLNLDDAFKIGVFKQLSQIQDIGLIIYQGFALYKKQQNEKLAKLQKDQNLFDQSMLHNTMTKQLGNNFQAKLKPLRYVEPTPMSSTARQITFQNATSEVKQSQFDQSISRSHIIRSATKIQSSPTKVKKLQIDFTGEIQKKKERDQVMSLIFKLLSSTMSFIHTLSLNPVIHPEIVVSGLAWKSLQQCYFALWQDEKKSLVESLLKDAIKTVQSLTSYAYVFTHEMQTNKSPFDEKNKFYQQIIAKYSDAKLKDIIIEFWFSMKKLLERKILNNLVLKFDLDEYSNSMMFGRTQDVEVQKFIKIFSIEEKSHELIWNNQSRDELLKILNEQLSNIEESFYDKIQKFDYQVNLNELRIESIFVKQFNSDIYYKPTDTMLFVKSLLENLKKRVDKQYLPDLSEQEYDDVLEITKALRNLIQYQKVLETKAVQYFLDNISLLCQMLKFKDSDNPNEIRIVTVGSIIYDILKIFSKNEKFLEGLIHNLEFVKMISFQLFSNENQTMTMDIEDQIKVIQIVQNLINIDDEEADQLLIKYGLVMLFLNSIFDRSVDKRIRVEIVKIMRDKLDELASIVQCFMPIHFFTQIEFQKNEIPANEDEMILNFLTHLDAHSYENLFLRWNSDLKDIQHQKIKTECDRILRNLVDWTDDFTSFDAKIPIEIYQNPLIKHEIQISDVITRIFNKNPALYIATDADTFLIKLCIQLDQQLFSLQQILNIFQKDDLDFEANNDDFIVQVRSEVFTIKQIRKKFKYLSQQTLQVMTSILLLIEQISQNSFNPNKRRNRNTASGIDNERSQSRSQLSYGGDLTKRESEGGYAPSSHRISSGNNLKVQSQQNTARTSVYLNQNQLQLQNEINQLLFDDMLQIPLQYIRFLEEWLVLPIFHSSILPIELRITFKQLLILSTEIPNTVEDLSEQMLVFTGRLLQQIVEEVDKKNGNNQYQKQVCILVEDVLKIYVIERMLMRGGKDQILKFYNHSDNLDNLKRIYFMSKKLVGIMSQIEIFKHIFQFIQLNSETQSELNWQELSLPRNLDLSTEHQSQEFQKLWRQKPTTSPDAKKLYSSTETTLLEDKLDEQQNNMAKLKNLPYISLKAVNEIKKEHAMGEDEMTVYSLIQDLESLEQKEMFWMDNKPNEIMDGM